MRLLQLVAIPWFIYILVLAEALSVSHLWQALLYSSHITVSMDSPLQAPSIASTALCTVPSRPACRSYLACVFCRILLILGYLQRRDLRRARRSRDPVLHGGRRSVFAHAPRRAAAEAAQASSHTRSSATGALRAQPAPHRAGSARGRCSSASVRSPPPRPPGFVAGLQAATAGVLTLFEIGALGASISFALQVTNPAPNGMIATSARKFVVCNRSAAGPDATAVPLATFVVFGSQRVSS
jgi:hypothetical protein